MESELLFEQGGSVFTVMLIREWLMLAHDRKVIDEVIFRHIIVSCVKDFSQ